MAEKNEKNPFGLGDPHEPRPLREFESDLKMKARKGLGTWESDYDSIQKLLNHLQRYTGSLKTREGYLRTVHKLCKKTNRSPDDLVRLDTEEIEGLIQNLGDDSADEGCGKRTVNSRMRILKTFFEVNGHDNLDLGMHHVPSRYSKRSQYIPRKEEIHRMARFTESLRDRAIILFLWTTGLRVSTALGLNYGDIQEEFESGEEFVKVPVYPEMKKRVVGACKGKIPYYTFAHPYAVRHLRIYLRRREVKYGPMEEDYPLFHSEWQHWNKEERTEKRLNRTSIQRTVKKSAKLAGIEEWENVTPHCLRKAFKSVLRAPTKNGGRLDEGTQEFFMGHILPGTQDEYYDKDNVDFHREEYSKLDFSFDEESFEFGPGRGEEEPSDILVEEEKLPDHLEQGWKFIEKIGNEKYILTKRDLS